MLSKIVDIVSPEQVIPNLNDPVVIIQVPIDQAENSTLQASNQIFISDLLIVENTIFLKINNLHESLFLVLRVDHVDDQEDSLENIICKLLGLLNVVQWLIASQLLIGGEVYLDIY